MISLNDRSVESDFKDEREKIMAGREYHRKFMMIDGRRKEFDLSSRLKSRRTAVVKRKLSMTLSFHYGSGT
jgi:hypothetical protein